MMRSSSPSPRPPLLRGLPERAYLTIKHHGWRDFLYRLVTAPLRLVGLEAGVRARLLRRAELRRIHSWYAENWRPVTVIVPSYGDPKLTIAAVQSLRRTTDAGRTRIVVVDDGSELEHQKQLHGFAGAEVVLSVQNGGYSTSINRGLEHAGEHDDIVVANNDILAEPGWLEAMQRAAYVDEETAAGIVGPRLLYPDGRIQSAGSYRNLGAPDWFDHRYRFKPADHGPAEIARARGRGHRGVHVHPARCADRRRPVRRGVPDGLRGRGLLPARVGGGTTVRYEPAPCSPTSSPPRAGSPSASASSPPRHASGRAGGRGSTSGTCARPTANCV